MSVDKIYEVRGFEKVDEESRASIAPDRYLYTRIRTFMKRTMRSRPS